MSSASFAGSELIAGAQVVQRDFLLGFSDYGAILADPPWQFETRTFAGLGRSPQGQSRAGQRRNQAENHYQTLTLADLAALPVGQLAALVAPRREHSRKPDEARERIERLVAGPYLELFAREAAPGWDVWGNQVDRFVGAPA